MCSHREPSGQPELPVATVRAAQGDEDSMELEVVGAVRRGNDESLGETREATSLKDPDPATDVVATREIATTGQL